jgi:23S rRNA G2069 N7-methylase RlmK/C1962 C5-methylase RlmI
MLANRVKNNARHLRKWAKRENVSCYRIYDKDIPEVPIAIDWYDGRLHGALYAKPELGRDWLAFVMLAAADALGVAETDVFLKVRERQRGSAQYRKQGDKSARFAVPEGGLQFWVNLTDYLDTGLFLDHRLTRRWVQEQAADKRVLNLFCYTGSFSIYAAAGGASHVTSVDLSSTYLSWAQDNLALNHMPDSHHQWVRDDAVGFLQNTRAEYDLVIVDPPTFSNSKRTERAFDLRRDHVELLRLVSRATRPGGQIVFSTNSSRFSFDESALPGAEIKETTAETIPEDFQRRRSHRCWVITPISERPEQ